MSKVVESNQPTSTPSTTAAIDKIKQNVNAKQNDAEYKENLKTLRRLVSQASPIIEDKETNQVVKDENGKEIDTPVTTKVTTGYNYYAINGKPIGDWVKETFGGKVTLDEKTREIKVNSEAKK